MEPYAGRRTVPIIGRLRHLLAEHRAATAAGPDDLVFGVFHPGATAKRARTAWKAAGLEPIGLHECRHTFASFLIAAGVNAKAICTFMGHSSITVTFDRYGHLMPGAEDEARGLLDAYLTGAEEPIAA